MKCIIKLKVNRNEKIALDELEIIKFYQQLVKMKVNRPHINPVQLVKKSYPKYDNILLEELIMRFESSLNKSSL